jgi:hypothetical protein
MKTIHELGKAAYAAYGQYTDNKNYQGLEMPRWEDLTPGIQGAWAYTVKLLLCKVGTVVFVNSCEGFGGPALIVETRDERGSHFKVRLQDGSQPDLWAHDFEIEQIEA